VEERAEEEEVGADAVHEREKSAESASWSNRCRYRGSRRHGSPLGSESNDARSWSAQASSYSSACSTSRGRRSDEAPRGRRLVLVRRQHMTMMLKRALMRLLSLSDTTTWNRLGLWTWSPRNVPLMLAMIPLLNSGSAVTVTAH